MSFRHVRRHRFFFCSDAIESTREFRYGRDNVCIFHYFFLPFFLTTILFCWFVRFCSRKKRGWNPSLTASLYAGRIILAYSRLSFWNCRCWKQKLLRKSASMPWGLIRFVLLIYNVCCAICRLVQYISYVVSQCKKICFILSSPFPHCHWRLAQRFIPKHTKGIRPRK